MQLLYVVGTCSQVHGATLYIDILVQILQENLFPKVICFSRRNLSYCKVPVLML